MPTHQANPNLQYWRYWLSLLLLAWLAFIPISARAAPAADIICGFDMTVHDANELNQAITCFNIATEPEEYELTLANDILLNAAPQPISNAIPGVSLQIDGATHRVDGQNSFRPFEIMANTVVTLQNITVTRGTTPDLSVKGGGINNQGTLTILNSTISHNTAVSSVLTGGQGGGIHNQGTLTIRDSTIRYNSIVDNSALEVPKGGGIYNEGTLTIQRTTISHNAITIESPIKAWGGGIYNQGTLTISDSTINNNTIQGLTEVFGGGIYNTGPLYITNSTISHNNANNLSGSGGGIYNRAFLIVTNSTINLNYAGLSGGGLYNATGLGNVTLRNTIIANSTNSDCTNSAGIINASYSLIADSLICVNGTNSETRTGNPKLGPLQDNGGPTFTHALAPDSPAIDAGDDATCADPNTVNNRDQRGIARPQVQHCDIGAYEANTGSITFVKQVNGGVAQPSDWTFTVADDPTPIAHNQVVAVPVGQHIVNEAGPQGYIVSGASGACALQNGQIRLTVTLNGGVCTITNTRETGQVTFIKQVNSGSASANEWTFDLISGPDGASLPTNIPHNGVHTLHTGTYVLTEKGPANYTTVSASGACQLVNGQLHLTVAPGDNSCIIVNEQMAVLVNEFFGHTWVREGANSGDGSQACVWLALNAKPSGPVTISLTPRNGQITLDKNSITLDSANWNRFDLAQPDNILCIRAVDDKIDERGSQQCKDGLSERFGGSVVSQAGCGDYLDFVDLAISNSVDPNFGASTPFVSNSSQDLDANPTSIDVLIQDNDQAGVSVTPTELTVQVGASAKYSVVLTSQPTAPVQIVLTPAGSFQTTANCPGGNAQTICLNFTPNNWNVPQSVTITGQNAGNGQITHQIVSNDGRYAALSVTPVKVTVVGSEQPQQPTPTPTPTPTPKPQPNTGQSRLFLPLIRK